MLARTADSLYWTMRYIERIDIIFRMLNNGFASGYDISDEISFNWSTLLNIFTNISQDESMQISSDPNNVFKILIEEDERNSVKELIIKARENARGAQEYLTKEVWESINKKYHKLNKINIQNIISKGEQVNFLLENIEYNQQFMGVFENTMHRGQGWNFMNLGRFSERCIQTLNIVEHKFKLYNQEEISNYHILFWKNLLLNLSGYEFFLKTYRSGDHSSNILNMVFFNKEFTRSIHYTLNKIYIYVQNILRDNYNFNNEKIYKTAGKLYAKVAYSDMEEIMHLGVVNYINKIKSDLYELTQLIGYSYFLYY